MPKQTPNKAFNQLQTYKREIPSLFTYNALLVISDGITAKAGSLSADYNRFMEWKTNTRYLSEVEGTEGLKMKENLPFPKPSQTERDKMINQLQVFKITSP